MTNIDWAKLFYWLGIGGFCLFFWWWVGRILTSPLSSWLLAEVMK